MAADALSHLATQRVDAPADVAFAFLADPIKLGGWSLGCFRTRSAGPDGLHVGTSLFDGGEAWVRIAADRGRGLVDFHVGTPERLVPRICARVVPGGIVDLPEESCLVSLIAWRGSGMDEARWLRLRACHDAEILLIKAQIEAHA